MGWRETVGLLLLNWVTCSGGPQLSPKMPRLDDAPIGFSMTHLVLIALGWMGLRTLLLLSQVSRHSSEARLGRAFQQELRDRGLIDLPPHP